MSPRKRSILVFVTLLSLVLSTMFILSFFNLTSIGGLGLDTATLVINGVVFLILYRHILRNPDLAENERHFWSIVVFMGLAAGQLLYLLRKVQLTSDRTATT